MAFRKLFNTWKCYFRSNPQVPEPKKFVGIGSLRYQATNLPDTLIVHADFSGKSLKTVFRHTAAAERLYTEYFNELQRLRLLGFNRLMAVVPVGRKSGLSMLLEQGGFVKDQEVFMLDLGGGAE